MIVVIYSSTTSRELKSRREEEKEEILPIHFCIANPISMMNQTNAAELAPDSRYLARQRHIMVLILIQKA